MRAMFSAIDPCLFMKGRQVEIISNSPQVEVTLDNSKNNSKYNKVGLKDRLQLLALVRSGSTIVKAAKTLNINYSTAKSIFQNMKARAAGKYKRRQLIQSSSQGDFLCKDEEWSNDPTKFK